MKQRHSAQEIPVTKCFRSLLHPTTKVSDEDGIDSQVHITLLVQMRRRHMHEKQQTQQSLQRKVTKQDKTNRTRLMAKLPCSI